MLGFVYTFPHRFPGIQKPLDQYGPQVVTSAAGSGTFKEEKKNDEDDVADDDDDIDLFGSDDEV